MLGNAGIGLLSAFMEASALRSGGGGEGLKFKKNIRLLLKKIFTKAPNSSSQADAWPPTQDKYGSPHFNAPSFLPAQLWRGIFKAYVILHMYPAVSVCSCVLGLFHVSI